MNVCHIEFDELYRRHLCRHSEFGINIIHLISLVGSYLGVFGIVYWLFGSVWVLFGLLATYVVVTAKSVPFRLLAVDVIIVLLILGSLLAMPALPWWVYVVWIVMCHQMQSLSHKYYTKAYDMSEFNVTYKKGIGLFVVLLIYELPLLLQYVLFDRKSKGC